MSPEQILSDPIDARSDIYSFGIVLFRWLTGELPFDTGPTLSLFAHHLESKAPPPSWLLEEIHPGLEKIILAAMRKNPANRYASMREVLEDLNCVLTGKGEVCGAPLVEAPDAYEPKTEQAVRACNILGRKGLSHQSSPRAIVRAPEQSAPVQSGVRVSDNGTDAVQEAGVKISAR